MSTSRGDHARDTRKLGSVDIPSEFGNYAWYALEAIGMLAVQFLMLGLDMPRADIRECETLSLVA